MSLGGGGGTTTHIPCTKSKYSFGNNVHTSSSKEGMGVHALGNVQVWRTKGCNIMLRAINSYHSCSKRDTWVQHFRQMPRRHEYKRRLGVGIKIPLYVNVRNLFTIVFKNYIYTHGILRE